MEKGTRTVALGTLNSKYVHASLAPWCIAAGMREYAPSFSCEVYEGTINEPCERVCEQILLCRPFAAGFACYIWNIEKTLRLAQLIKEQSPDTIVFLGGPEVSPRGAQILQSYAFIDCVVCGEGEESVPAMLLALCQGRDPEIAGVCFRKGGKIVCVPKAPLKSEPPCPYSPQFFAALKGRIAYIETTRGCPYSCAFCLSGECGGLRRFSLEKAKENIISLSQSGARTIKFVDRTFNADDARANEILRFIADNYKGKIPDKVCFHFELAGDILTDETMCLLEQMPTGAVQLEIGLQSFNEKTLAAVRRKTNIKKLTENLRRVISFKNMHIHIDLIAGLPQEGLRELAHSFNTAYALGANMLQLGFLKLLHGAAMRDEPDEFPCEFSENPPYEVLSTPWLSAQDLKIVKNAEDALERLYNSGRFLRTLEYVFAATTKDAFSIFSNIQAAAAKTPLDEYAKQIFLCFKNLDGVDEVRLRDEMVKDWLSFNSTGRLAPFMQIRDNRLKSAVKILAANAETALAPHTKRGIALLYGERAIVYADYVCKDEITGQYPINIIKSAELFG